MNDSEMTVHLTKLFVEFRKKPVLFVGSGFSRRYLDSPSWNDLLEYVAKKLNTTRYPLLSYTTKADVYIKEKSLPSSSKFPVTASFLEEDYNLKFFSEDSFEEAIKNTYDTEIKSGISPFKIMICHYIKSFNEKTSTFDSEIALLQKITKRVSNFITTNYDNLLEEIFPTYNPIVGQTDMLNNSFLSIGNIFKIHGSNNYPDSIVITEEDYSNFDMRKKFLSAKLLTFFLENPVIFIGYSIEDSNIKNILTDIQSCLSPENKLKLSKNLLFIDRVESEETQGIVDIEISGIRMTRVQLSDYNLIYSAFGSIKDGIDIGILRMIEEKIAQLVQTSNPQDDKVYAAQLFDSTLSSSDIAILIARGDSVFKYGYETIGILDICEDVLFENKNYDSTGIINHSILSQKTRYSTSKLPLHKYLKDYTSDLDKFYKHSKCIIESIDDIYNPSDRNTGLYKNSVTELSDLIIANDLKKTLDNIYLSLRTLDKNEVKAFLCTNWLQLIEIPSIKTHLTKTVCVIDLLENRKTTT